MNNFEELGRIVTEQALEKRHLKNAADEFKRINEGCFVAEYQMERSDTYRNAMAYIKALQSRKIKLLNKCKKEFKLNSIKVV